MCAAGLVAFVLLASSQLSVASGVSCSPFLPAGLMPAGVGTLASRDSVRVGTVTPRRPLPAGSLVTFPHRCHTRSAPSAVQSVAF